MVLESVLPVRFRQYKEGEGSKKLGFRQVSSKTNRERCPQKTTLIQTLKIRTYLLKNFSE